MWFLNLFQKIREYSRFHWVDGVLVLIKNYPSFYLLLLWSLYFLFDQVVSIFHPQSFPFLVSLLNLLLGTPFILFLFFFYFPACKSKIDLGFLSIKAIEIVIFLTVAKFVLLGFRDNSYSQQDNYLLLEEILRFLNFAFFTFLWWIFREFFLAVMTNLTIQMDLYKALSDLDHAALSPHFLFNALNNIAGRSSLYSDKLYHLIKAFSSLLHQSYKSPNEPHFIPDEIAIVNNMISLAEGVNTKLTVHLHVEYDKPLEYLRIPKLTLGTLMENMIKYGITEDAATPAEMVINIKTVEDGNTQLTCTTYNLVHPYRPNFSTGRGLIALSNVLRGKFGDQAIFEWTQNQNEFKTLLVLNYGYIETGTNR